MLSFLARAHSAFYFTDCLLLEVTNQLVTTTYVTEFTICTQTLEINNLSCDLILMLWYCTLCLTSTSTIRRQSMPILANFILLSNL